MILVPSFSRIRIRLPPKGLLKSPVTISFNVFHRWRDLWLWSCKRNATGPAHFRNHLHVDAFEEERTRRRVEHNNHANFQAMMRARDASIPMVKAGMSAKLRSSWRRTRRASSPVMFLSSTAAAPLLFQLRDGRENRHSLVGQRPERRHELPSSAYYYVRGASAAE
jgi:hypothetical protein